MSRTTVDPRIPNLQSQQMTTPVRPAHLDAGVKTERGGSSEPRDVAKEEVLGGYTGIVGSVVTGNNADHPDCPKPRYYRVVKEGLFKPRNSPDKSMLREGRMIDNLNYDIKAVVNQGIKLVEVDAEGEELKAKDTK